MKMSLVHFLNNLKNYSILKKEFLKIKYTSKFAAIVKQLYAEGFIQSFQIVLIKNESYLYIKIRTFFNKAIFKGLTIISNSSNKKFLSFKDLYKLPERKKALFISTDKGILTLQQCKNYKIGGEVLFSC